MPIDLIFAIIMLIVCILMIIWMLYELFNKIRNEYLAAGAAFWITLFFLGAIICSARISLWY